MLCVQESVAHAVAHDLGIILIFPIIQYKLKLEWLVLIFKNHLLII